MQTNERGVDGMISRELLNEAYSELEAKHDDIMHILKRQGFSLESGWYNGHYQKESDGKWVRDAYPIPVITVKELCDIEIQFDSISVSTKRKREMALAYSFQPLMKYDFEVYGVEDYLSDYYHLGQSVQEMKEKIQKSSEAEIGISFSFPFEVTGQEVSELVKLLGQEGFYY